MENLCQTYAIILSKKNWREDDLLFSFFTKEFGRLDIVAIGARKLKSKLVGHLSSLGMIEINFVRGRSNNKLTHAYLIKHLPVEDTELYNFIHITREVVEKSFTSEEKNLPVWELVQWTEERLLESHDKNIKKIIINIFLIQVLKILGYTINPDNNLSGPIASLLEDFRIGRIKQSKFLNKYNNNLLFDFLKRQIIRQLEVSINTFKGI
jgi:DNA repair protein RecO (recombination protein O)